MKKSMQKTIYRTALSIILIIVTNSVVFSQTNTKSSKFLILVETTDDGLKLTGQEGCAWKKLTFTIKTGRYQAIDQYGMTFLNEHKLTEDKSLPEFLLVFKKTEDGIAIEGKEGTAWGFLSFSGKGECHQYINFNGMASGE